MKKTLLIIACFISSFSFSQLADGSFAPDFTVTDIEGETHNLYDILDDGKTVILDLFATWCGPCWNYAATGVLEDLQSQNPSTVFCMAVEADPSTAESTIYNSDLGNWTSVIDYMLADDPSGNIAEDYELAYYPTIYMICPDRSVKEVGQLGSVSAFMSEINACSQATFSKDMKMVAYTGDGTYCNGTVENTSVRVQNYSINSTVSSFNILTMVNGNTVNTTPWSGNLQTYQTAEIDLGGITNVPDGANISFSVDYPGDQDSNNNMVYPGISGSTESSVSVSLFLLTDNWGSETTWELRNENGQIVESGGPYPDGDLSNYEYNWQLNYGCYTFNIFDAYGDGVEGTLYNGGSDGYVSLNDQSNGVLWYGIQYGEGESIAFEVMPGLDVEEERNNEVSIYPNPSIDFTNLNLYLANKENIKIKLFNSLGQVVKTENKGLMPSGNHNMKINLDGLVEGLYFIELQIGNSIELHSINVVK